MVRSPMRDVLRRAQSTAEALRMFGRLSRDIAAFWRRPVTLAESEEWQRERLASREQWLVRVAEGQIYANPHSPYLRLLRAAGCEAGDFRSLVAQEGVEGALEQLAARGMYISYDEFKGRREAVRGSQRFTFAEAEFDNPLAGAHYAMSTGGTGGRRSRVLRSLPFVVETTHSVLPALAANDALHRVHATWETGPVNHLLRHPKMRVPLGAWFYPLAPLPWLARLGGTYLMALGRLSGHRLPLPRHGDIRQPHAVLDWLLQQRRRGRQVCMMCTGSAAVRTAALAVERGATLEGVAFFVRSEPLTPARLDAIQASGARAFANYGMTEASIIGISCGVPAAPDDVHVFDSRYAVVQRRRHFDAAGAEIDALALTTLTDHAPKTLLNVETGDSATIVRRDCGCSLGALGLRTHLSHIRSFEKLTGEGMTFARSNLAQIVETVLPARFGGGSIDYQVLEEERPDGLPRLVLRVSPSVGTLDEEAVRAAFLAALAQDGGLEQYMARFWERANTIEVERALPHVTPAGKILPFHLLRAAPAR